MQITGLALGHWLDRRVRRSRPAPGGELRMHGEDLEPPEAPLAR